MTLFYPGNHEGVKAGCHGAMCGLAAIFTLYNGVAWMLRGEKHLARNTAIYGALTVLEWYQVSKHSERAR